MIKGASSISDKSVSISNNLKIDVAFRKQKYSFTDAFDELHLVPFSNAAHYGLNIMFKCYMYFADLKAYTYSLCDI